MNQPVLPQAIPTNPKRRYNHWEPVYKPEKASLKFYPFDWNLESSHGPKQSVCSAVALKNAIVSRKTHTIRKATFSTCDFDGSFDFCRISFKNCRFEDCDFGRSEWKNAKFSGCIFEKCSLSTAHFTDVQFIDCEWSETGISAEEMSFSRVLISNSYEFIQSAYTNTDKNVLAQKNTDPDYQLYRLEKTKAKVARMVLVAAQAAADDDAFYNAVMAHTDQVSAWKAAEAWRHAKHKTCFRKLFWYPVWLLYWIERLLLRASGLINGWGGKIGRAALCGLALVVAFTAIYFLTGVSADYKSAFLAATEITLLVGYTKYTSLTTCFHHQIIIAFNMLLGLWWYAVFVPTVINRVSRLKQ